MPDMHQAEVTVDWLSGRLSGKPLRTKEKKLGELAGLFRDQNAFVEMDSMQVVYSVQYWMPVPAGTPGGLFWGNTTLQPGRVGDEYFMTAGHFHAERDRSEFYATAKGEGILLLIDQAGRSEAQTMHPGSLHFIPGGIGHRVVNTGGSPLTFLACWPSDAGHDYETARSLGFGVRVRRINGVTRLIQDGDNSRGRP